MTGRLVSVAQAAQLAHRSERAVRWRITHGYLVAQTGEDGHMRVDTDALSRIPGWRVDAARLATLDAPVAAPALDDRLRAMERRIAALERLLVAPPAEEPVERGPRTVTLADRGAGQPLAFATKTTAARWLLRHGIHSESTPKTWPGWPPLDLTPGGVLGFALAVEQAARARGDWRVTWRLRRCADPACVCGEVLPTD